MGTFHHGHGELHGITVVVDTPGGTAYIGRLDTRDDRGLVLRDVDVRAGPANTPAREAWIRQAARVGVWKQLDHVFVPAAEVASVRRLGDIPRA
jgi:hypothetical protein